MSEPIGDEQKKQVDRAYAAWVNRLWEAVNEARIEFQKKQRKQYGRLSAD